MDISHKGQKVGLLFAEDGSIPVLKEMARTVVTVIVVLGVPGKEFSHEGGNPLSAASDQEMDVILHEYPGVDRRSGLNDVLAHPVNKAIPILVVSEDG